MDWEVNVTVFVSIVQGANEEGFPWLAFRPFSLNQFEWGLSFDWDLEEEFPRDVRSWWRAIIRGNWLTREPLDGEFHGIFGGLKPLSRSTWKFLTCTLPTFGVAWVDLYLSFVDSHGLKTEWFSISVLLLLEDRSKVDTFCYDLDFFFLHHAFSSWVFDLAIVIYYNLPIIANYRQSFQPWTSWRLLCQKRFLSSKIVLHKE